MAESLNKFMIRRGIKTEKGKQKLPKISSRSDIFAFWKNFDRNSSDIAYIHSRFFTHTEFSAYYYHFRRMFRKFFSTRLRDENIKLFTDSSGHLRIKKGSVIRSFLSSRLSLHHRTVRESLPYFIISLSLFIAATVAGFSIVNYFSHYGEFFIPENIQESLSRGELWTNMLNSRPVSGGSQIIINNVVVSLKAFGFGIIAGLPSIFIVLFNGWHLGSIMAATHKFNMASSLIQFVSNHGILEILIIIFSCALGMRVGLSFFSIPRGFRFSYFASRFWESFNSMIIVSCWLFLCGIVESQVSPHIANMKPHSVMIPVSLLIGIGVFSLYLVVHHGIRYDSKK
jgi:uncharacterized membrane protein SpoIIM required for sporulation